MLFYYLSLDKDATQGRKRISGIMQRAYVALFVPAISVKGQRQISSQKFVTNIKTST